MCGYSNFGFRVACNKCDKKRGSLPETEEQKKEREEAWERRVKEAEEASVRSRKNEAEYVIEEDERAILLAWPGNWRENEYLESKRCCSLVWKIK